MKPLIGSLFTISILAGALYISPAQAQTAQAVLTAPAGFPANLRYNLVPTWIEWAAEKVTISWPPNDGCAGAPEVRSLTAGQLIDRFGSEGGTFFSPRGESFASRAVP